MLDSKLNYGEHIIRVADKAVKVVASRGTLMANVNGPRPCMRRLLMRAAEAVMLYGAEVLVDALRKEKYRKRIAAVQRRGTLRIACSYRMVSEPAVLVVGGVIPIDLLAQERKFVHQQRCVWERRRHQGSPGLSASRPGKVDGSRYVGADGLPDSLVS
ncbi:uncharacterized protein LOC118449124 [Vespa mandarinia]|uniref:uncharacterized protein LOC118449124 n=1 Tax=Vespa mandarinia TaxID=7446 RepID=UPI00160DFE82|nr:uncharacterized protein LOC118449124 [Vespa mandarinia]